ncbi:acyl-CoA desaturase [Lapillicoccus sp.]|uniref:fatty acid desaturase family protein n=1 Tax=Lapillicoccus sp. TaxID=1909287 RepID=UPI0025D11D5C|nr:acyl-CoA desaturase [Lapillicoccus sp.]
MASQPTAMTMEDGGEDRRPRARTRARDHVSTYAVLLQQMRDHGLMRRRLGFYWVYAAILFGSLGLLGVAFALLGDSWLQLLVATGLAVIFAQFGFLGHDAAHRQIFASSRWNVWSARIISTLFIGLSHGWWVHKHNKHHNSPNQLDTDPDIAPGVLAFTPELATARAAIPGFAGWFTRHQGWFFFPLLMLEGLALHVAGIRTLIERRDLPHRLLEAVLLTVRLVGYVAVLFVFLPPSKAVAFLGLQLAVFGVLLGGSFAPNHKGMPIVPRGMRLDFVQRQVVMSRNIRGSWFVDSAMGGLNYQIEHHLFPSMARPNLKRAKPLVEAFCREHGITYTEVSLPASYGIVVRYLNTVGLSERDPFACPLMADLR